MSNLALGKPIEEPIKNPSAATDGQTTQYSDYKGFAEFTWPYMLTVDLGSTYTLFCIRILLWDGLGQDGKQRDSRIYKYRLLTSVDHQAWKVIFDSSKDGGNGWQVFDFPDALKARYIRLHGLSNSANEYFQIVQIEAHDSVPSDLDAETILQRTILTADLEEEVGDGLPLQARVGGIINGIERLIEGNDLLNPTPFRELISQLRVQVRDVASLERGMVSIRREITDPVRLELERSAQLGKFSVWGFWVGLIGGILAIISIGLALIQWLGPKPMVTPKRDDESEIILQKNTAPNGFYISYSLSPPGKHDWAKMGDDSWIEKYPNGETKEFHVSDRVISDKCAGSLLYSVKDTDFEIFIPDLGCPAMQLRARYKKGQWGSLGEMQDVH